MKTIRWVVLGFVAVLLALFMPSVFAHAQAASGLTAVVVTPSQTSITVGSAGQFVATPMTATGAFVGATVTWSSSNTAVATVSSAGWVTAAAIGTATITATAVDPTTNTTVTGTAALTVTGIVPQLTYVVLAPISSGGVVGTLIQLVATPEDQTLAPYPSATVTWVSSNTSVATVSTTGLVTTLAPGTAIITATATSGIISTSAISTITVLAPALMTVQISPQPIPPAVTTIPIGTSIAFTGTPMNQSLLPYTGSTTVAWSSSNPAILSVSASGVATGVSAGGARIIATATSGSVTVTNSLAVTVPQPLASVSISPGTASVASGGTQQLTAFPFTATGVVYIGAALSWSSSNTAAAVVDSTGLVTALTAGTTTITVTAVANGVTVSNSALITVTPPVLSAVQISPFTNALVAGQTQLYAGTPLNQSGGTYAGATVTWVSSNPAIATISTNGFLTALAAGTTTVTATAVSGASSASSGMLLTVSAPVLTSSSITPASIALVVGSTAVPSAKPVNQLGTAYVGAVTAWGTSNPAVAIVSAAGVVSGVGIGTATITATSTSGTISVVATAAVTVGAQALTSVAVAPTSAALVAGGSQQLSASSFDQVGNLLSGATITWGSNAPAVATVSASGLVTGVGAGSALISATSTIGAVSVVTTVPISVSALSSATLALNPGWNLVTLPLSPVNPTTGVAIAYTAESFGTLAGADVISSWSNVSQRFTTHIIGFPLNDFPLVNGSGFFVHVAAGKSLAIAGTAVGAAAPVLGTGWSLIGWTGSAATTASAYGATLAGVDALSRYDSVTQSFTTHIMNFPLNDFALQPGDGVFAHHP